MRYLIRRFIDFIRDPWYEPIVETLADQKKWIKKEGKEEGIKIGTKRTNINVAKAMIKENISEDTITKITGLPIKEIEKLRNHN